MKKILLSCFCLVALGVAAQETFTATTVEGVEMLFKVLSEEDKTCCVGTDKFELINPDQEPSATNLTCLAIDYTTTGDITIPATANGYTVVRIGEAAFADCQHITGVNIPETVTSISHMAFWQCYELKSVELSDNVTELGTSVFLGCDKLESIRLPQGITEIPSGFLQSCHSLESIVLPTSLTTIGYGAFGFCTSLKNVVVPNGVTLLDEYAFMHCEGLETIFLPPTLKEIRNGAFTDCHMLQAVEVPNGIESLGDVTFWNCHSLTTFSLPATLTHIGTFLFASCENITSIYSYLPEPIELGAMGVTLTFSMLPGATNGDCTLYVPKGTVEAYRAAEGWNVFVNIEEMPYPTAIDDVNADAAVDAQHYNVLGQPIAPNTPGIHIVGGQKILVK